MLSDMNHSFSIIAQSETKINVGIDPYINTDISGYCFLSQPSMSKAGGCWLLYQKLSFLHYKR